MADIFISYKREDRRFAERLSIALEQLGFDVWWDFELLSGDRFRKVIEKVIDECAATIVLWSQLSRESTFVVDEAAYARDQNKLCPARIDDCRLPLGFGGDHVVDLSAWDGEMGHEGLQGILRALEAKTGKKARLGARPRDVDDQKRFAEMEAFKAAQAAENLSALRAFLRDYPEGAFAKFVRAQVEELQARAPKAEAAAATPQPFPSAPVETRPPQHEQHPENTPPRAPPPQTGDASTQKRLPWPMIGIGGALAIALLALVVALRPWEGEQIATEEPAATTAEAPRDVDAEIEAARREERERAQAEFAEREQSPQTQTTPTTRPTATGSAAYDLAQLHPDVRRAVEQARETERRANAAAARARDAAQRAQAAALRARNGEAGHRAETLTEDDPPFTARYETEYSNGARNGYGVQTYTAGVWVGDVYAGQYSGGARRGSGVYRLGQNANNTSGSLRYEGEFVDSDYSGVGAFLWSSGDRYAGDWRDNQKNGPGVHYFADGRRYEGEWSESRYNGYGVFWDAQGRVVQAGIWTDSQLTQTLTQ